MGGISEESSIIKGKLEIEDKTVKGETTRKRC
jgi:hypothetical protein